MNHAEFNNTMQKLGQAEENLHIAYRQACITISTDLKKFNEAMCELRQSEENLHKALQDVYAAIHSEDFVAEVLKVSRPSKEDILKYIEENKY